LGFLPYCDNDKQNDHTLRAKWVFVVLKSKFKYKTYINNSMIINWNYTKP